MNESAITFLTHAGPGLLAAMWWTGITTGLIGLVCMIYVVAARVGARDERGPESDPGWAPPMDDVDAELFRILADARLGDISTRRLHGRARDADQESRLVHRSTFPTRWGSKR